MLAFEQAIDRVSQLDLQTLSVYNIDIVNVSALYDLADQFNVLGHRGWNLADTEIKKRDLIKRSIALHRTAGTPYAIKQALDAVGYPNSTIIENPAKRYDGSITYNGSIPYGKSPYGTFIVTLSSAVPAPNQTQIRLIFLLIEEWKNLRSVLVDLRQNNRSLIVNPLFYNGSVRYDGTQTYDGTEAA
jgi:P2-related tail formation protein